MLDRGFEDFNLQLAQPPGRFDLNTQLGGQGCGGLGDCELLLRQLRIVFPDRFKHGQPLKGTTEIQLKFAIGHLSRTEQTLCQFTNKGLG